MTRRWALACTASALALATFPGGAWAHGLVGRRDLPVPEWLFGWGAGLVLAASFAGLAVLWPTPRLQEARGRRLFPVPRAVDVLCGAIGIALFALVVYSGLAGSQTPTANLAPTVVYVVVWVGMVVASALLGDVFRAFSPWRAIARAFAWAASRVAGDRLPEPLPYPERWGRWPAAATILAFVWVELAYSRGDDPSTLALLAILYAGAQLVGMSLYGIEQWTSRADGFGVYFNLFARLSVFERRKRVVYLRPPLSGVTDLEIVPGTVALLCVAIGTTSFDGLSQGPVWGSVLPTVLDWLLALGIPQQTGAELAGGLGIVACVLVIAALYRLGAAGMRTVGDGHDTRELAGRFAHSLVPIALAYAIAHYFSLLAYQGQAIAFLISDPLGTGSNLFGTAAVGIDYDAIRSTGVWYVQVGALAVGHLCGLILAHDRAIALYREPAEATRSQYWMLAVMITFTSLGLWLLSATGQ